jgi:hypothetical protein
MEEVYISNSKTGVAANPASEDIQMEIRDILLAPAAIILNGLNDVNIENPTDGQILKYNIIEHKWENIMPSGATGYTDRGDPSSADFSKTDFTIDGGWHILNLSSIVPEGAATVHFSIAALTAFNDQTIVFVKRGIVNKKNGATIRVPHGAKEYFKSDWVACDSDRKVEYWISPVTWITLDFLVRGWM